MIGQQMTQYFSIRFQSWILEKSFCCFVFGFSFFFIVVVLCERIHASMFTVPHFARLYVLYSALQYMVVYIKQHEICKSSDIALKTVWVKTMIFFGLVEYTIVCSCFKNPLTIMIHLLSGDCVLCIVIKEGLQKVDSVHLTGPLSNTLYEQ